MVGLGTIIQGGDGLGWWFNLEEKDLKWGEN
jgi:hypothetical protein